VVANRLSLLRRADVILVLDEGRLVQRGTHDELERVPGPYRETALLQHMDLGVETAADDTQGKRDTAGAAVGDALKLEFRK
jgi:hypothetical protein